MLNSDWEFVLNHYFGEANRAINLLANLVIDNPLPLVKLEHPANALAPILFDDYSGVARPCLLNQ